MERVVKAMYHIADKLGLKAKYKCLKCGFRYEIEPEVTQCSKCKHLYVKWLNYEEMHKLWVKNGSDLYRKIYV